MRRAHAVFSHDETLARQNPYTVPTETLSPNPLFSVFFVDFDRFEVSIKPYLLAYLNRPGKHAENSPATPQFSSEDDFLSMSYINTVLRMLSTVSKNREVQKSRE
ncbi:uncharacterized protein LOC109723576 isoform X2 [Ananas comosus]|uniref:Uncharacterized protein LOC109723576 isoform X2 n=1 Tax=Ananas comosus TaxID=4615 RepID=A0A6P5GG33_ANACO|nr:uncharacterized protein LOC109723576 isoform X2 [Ananas comosus]